MAQAYGLDDTIAALATPPDPAFRRIVRLSGPRAHEIARRVVSTSDWPHRFPSAIPGTLADAPAPVPVDLWIWPEKRSYTGEPMVEIHLPGAVSIARWVLERCLEHGARSAQPGEFTLRAFLNGKIDLTQAEAVLALVHANDTATMKVALEQLDGGLRRPLEQVRQELLDAVVELEAALDFAEEDIEFISRSQLAAIIDRAIQRLEEIRAQMEERETLRGRVRVVLAGPPNAGKSSLFNKLAGKDLAIVDPHPGTTLDYLCATVRIGQTEVELVDTAGLMEQTPDGIDRLGQEATETALQRATVELWCCPADGADLPALQRPPQWILLTKADLLSDSERQERLQQLQRRYPGATVVAVSVVGPPGVEPLIRALEQGLQELPAVHPGSVVAETAARCRDAITKALDHLREAASAVQADVPDDLLATLLRSALDQIGQVTGAVDVEEILDQIFSRFCIGK